MVDVNIIYDGKHERSNDAGLLRVQTEIVDKVGRDVENSPGFPGGTSSPNRHWGGVIGRRRDAVAPEGAGQWGRGSTG